MYTRPTTEHSVMSWWKKKKNRSMQHSTHEARLDMTHCAETKEDTLQSSAS